MITIIDCSINNLRSVEKAFQHLGHPVAIARSAEEVARADKLVLPGVAAFGATMAALRAAGLVGSVVERARGGVPFLGICVGEQLLFERSEELGDNAGLGLLQGDVVRFPDLPELKVPHIGWSALSFPRPTRLFAGIEPGAMVYFVHSFYARPCNLDAVAATAHHGIDFCAAVECDNIMAVQFHAEKSSRIGLHILDNFARL
jgi:glutamine amidotransferase